MYEIRAIDTNDYVYIYTSEKDIDKYEQYLSFNDIEGRYVIIVFHNMRIIEITEKENDKKDTV